MINAIYGKKIGMTQIFNEDDQVVPVTIIVAEPNKVCQVKTAATDGYEAVRLVLALSSPRRSPSPWAAISPSSAPSPFATCVRFASRMLLSTRPATCRPLAAFADVKKVDVTGTSKGKGFAGVIKRHGFAGGPGGHGAHFHRAPGSIGQCATPSRVFKGVRLPGHMGCDTVTVKNLEVVRVDAEQNLILVKGAVPGGKNGIVRVRMA